MQQQCSTGHLKQAKDYDSIWGGVAMTRTDLTVGDMVIAVRYDKESGNTWLGITWPGQYGPGFATGEMTPELVAGVISVLREGGKTTLPSPPAQRALAPGKDGPREVWFSQPEISIRNSKTRGTKLFVDGPRNLHVSKNLNAEQIATLITALNEAPTPERLGRRIRDQVKRLGNKVRAIAKRPGRKYLKEYDDFLR
jgi:hypothetical protein